MLEAEVAELKSRLGKNSSNSSKPPSTDPSHRLRDRKRKPSGRKPGGQPGHGRHGRALVPESELTSPPVDCRPAACGHCGEPLSGDDPAPERHQSVELPPPQAIRTEHRCHSLACAKCGKKTRAPKPAEAAPFGPRLRATLAHLVAVCRLSRRDAQRFLQTYHGVSISLGQLSELESEMAELLARPCEEIAAALRDAKQLHIDDSGWTEGIRPPKEGETKTRKRAKYLHVVATKAGAFYRILGGRGRKQAEEMLGGSEAHAMSDRHSAYSRLAPGRHGYCWSHLLRDFEAVGERRGDAGRIGRALHEGAGRVFRALALRRDGVVTLEVAKKLLESERSHFAELLALGVESADRKLARFCKGIAKVMGKMWHFIDDPELEATNNRAERALRHAVLARKTSFGSMSEAGSRFIERMFTLRETARIQGRDALGILAALAAGKPVSLLPSTQPSGP